MGETIHTLAVFGRAVGGWRKEEEGRRYNKGWKNRAEQLWAYGQRSGGQT